MNTEPLSQKQLHRQQGKTAHRKENGVGDGVAGLGQDVNTDVGQASSFVQLDMEIFLNHTIRRSPTFGQVSSFLDSNMDMVFKVQYLKGFNVPYFEHQSPFRDTYQMKIFMARHLILSKIMFMFFDIKVLKLIFNRLTCWPSPNPFT